VLKPRYSTMTLFCFISMVMCEYNCAFMAVASRWDIIHYTTQPGVFGGWYADYFVKKNAETLDIFFVLPGNVRTFWFQTP